MIAGISTAREQTLNDPGSTVAVVWQRFGPYHFARLRGAAEVLASSGWNVIGIEVAGADEYEWHLRCDSLVGRETLFPNQNYSGLTAPAIGRRMGEVLERLDPAAVCLNGWAAPEAVAALRWARSHARLTVLMSETFESRFNPLKQAVKRWRVGQCDAAIVGGCLQSRYLETLGFDTQSIEIGYDVVDNAHFSAPASIPSILNGVTRHRYFFANARFLERKGIDALLRAYANYRSVRVPSSAGEPWSLVVSGSGEMEARWKKLADSLNLAGSVRWLGFLQYEELPGAYQAAGAFVHPARREPWGLVVNEAAAAGLPLIVGRRVGAACELVRHGQNGFLVDPDDVEAFTAFLLRMTQLSDYERRAMGSVSEGLVSALGPQRFGQALRRCLRLAS